MNPPPEFCCFNRNSCMGIDGSEVVVNDKLMVQELNELSCQERESVYNEIHGVAALQEETQDFIQTCCQNLQDNLGMESKMKRRAYDRAIFLKPSLEHDTKFQLMFLRAERYDAFRAATRLCKYFTNKLLLFGDEKLVTDITLDDLDEGDIAVLETGPYVRLPDKDQSGRTVLFVDCRQFRFNWKEMTRYAWYHTMSQLTDEETQRSGVVNISYAVGVQGTPPQLIGMISKGSSILVDSLPVRFVGIHWCFDNQTVAPVLSTIHMIIGTQNRIRLRTHLGSHLEAQYTLLTFGIRVPKYLIFPNEKERKATTAAILKERQEIEKKEASVELESLPPGICALYPGPNDVLLGRGRPFHEFTGNQRMNDLMEEHQDGYCSAITRLDKTFIAMEIYQHITNYGGRFLERIDRQGWSRVTKERGEQKVLRALRNRFRDGDPTSDTDTSPQRANKKIKRSVFEDEMEK